MPLCGSMAGQTLHVDQCRVERSANKPERAQRYILETETGAAATTAKRAAFCYVGSNATYMLGHLNMRTAGFGTTSQSSEHPAPLTSRAECRPLLLGFSR